MPSAHAVVQTPVQSYQQQQPKSPASSLPRLPQQQRPVSIHGFSSLQNQFEAPSKPLSPLPMLQTNFPQYSPPQNQAAPQQNISFGSPRGWSHVKAPRSPGGSFNQPKQFYATGAQPLSPPFELPTAPIYSSQVRLKNILESHTRYLLRYQGLLLI